MASYAFSVDTWLGVTVHAISGGPLKRAFHDPRYTVLMMVRSTRPDPRLSPVNRVPGYPHIWSPAAQDQRMLPVKFKKFVEVALAQDLADVCPGNRSGEGRHLNDGRYRDYRKNRKRGNLGNISVPFYIGFLFHVQSDTDHCAFDV